MSVPDLSIPSLFNVRDKIALVTGGGSGLGTMIASALAQNGAKVYIAARKELQLRKAAEEMSHGTRHKVQYIVANVSSKAGCEALINEFKKRENNLHILVNNSGVAWGAPFNDVPEHNGWDNVFNVNVKSIFYTTSGLADLLAKGSTSIDPAHVINISSVASLIGEAEDALSAPGTGVWSYGPSKAAVNHLTVQLATALASRHVNVNAILPGVFPSKMTAWALREHGDSQFIAGQPSGRVGIPQDMAGVALFLSSSASAHVTGSCIPLDGGRVLVAGGLAPKAKL